MISAFGIVSERDLGNPMRSRAVWLRRSLPQRLGCAFAIMTLIPYNYFRSKIEHLTERMEAQATRLELFLSR